MAEAWTDQQLEALDAAHELDVRVPRADGSWTAWTPIWVVRVDDVAYARTWHARTTGWYGGAVRTGRAQARVPGVEADVVVDRVTDDALDERVSDAYRAKYGAGASSMVTAESAATTLRLRPVEGAPG